MNTKEYNIAVKTYSGRLFRFAVKTMKNQDDANDIVQDCYMKLWENKDKIDFEKAKSWLFTTAYNGSLNKIKKGNRSQSLEGSKYNEPSVESDDFELREIINKSLNSLPAIQKSIILLRDLEGYNYKEISEILNLNESQVKVYLFRGRQMVKNQLKEAKLFA
ncbi:MAG TPA: RNA polymerase sigma factor [Flavobacteriales bacterium]|nr:RNA polymerase sigma factor [Flavobacteriales bacterium]HIN39344.1 RNA polymerase sigma factor [Flavobacteriales bacterium]